MRGRPAPGAANVSETLAPLAQLIFELRREHLQEFIVVRGEGKFKVGNAQNQRITSGAIFHRAAEVVLQTILALSTAVRVRRA
jgi:hypothetical protein